MSKAINAATLHASSSFCLELSRPTGLPAFTPILSDCLHFLNTLPAIRTIAAGTLLVEQGVPARTVYLLETGLVKLVHLNACGREVMIGLRSEGWYAGCASALLSITQAYSVRAITPCKVVRLSTEDFFRCLRQNSEMLSHFLSVLCIEVACQASLQVEMMANSAEARLEHFMGERMHKHLSPRSLDPLPALKQMELAQLLAVTPEHLSRLMKKKKSAIRRRAIANFATDSKN